MAKSKFFLIGWIDQVNPNQVDHIQLRKSSWANYVDAIKFNKLSWSNFVDLIKFYYTRQSLFGQVD